MNKFIGIATIALVFASCQNSANPNGPVTPRTAPANSSTISTPPPTATDSNQPANIINTSAAPATNKAADNVAKNPVHGAPGHRCDIPVGAPLNSPAGATTSPASSNPPPVFTPTTQQPANSNVKLNPAHGQPGHDCAIPVGQPLKS
jgi:hypothetical protein